MLRRMSLGRMVVGVATLIAATHTASETIAATPPGCFFGVWMINEQLTKRVRPQRGLMVFLAPWG
jgi:hypothetical protein